MPKSKKPESKALSAYREDAETFIRHAERAFGIDTPIPQEDREAAVKNILQAIDQAHAALNALRGALVKKDASKLVQLSKGNGVLVVYQESSRVDFGIAVDLKNLKQGVVATNTPNTTSDPLDVSVGLRRK